MKYKYIGKSEGKTILLIHGGGLSWWAYDALIKLLSNDYCVIAAIIDGHGESYETDFMSIQQTAQNILNDLKNMNKESVFLIIGFSLGAQITLELLQNNPNIAAHFIIESALVKPLSGINSWFLKSAKALYPLTQKEWFSKLQAKSMGISDDLILHYCEDSRKMSPVSFINMLQSNSTYKLKMDHIQTKGRVLVLVGQKELKIMRDSAELVHKCILNSELQVLKGLKHGEFSLKHTEDLYALIQGL